MPTLIRGTGIDYDYSRMNYLDRGSDNVYLAMDLTTAPGQLVAVKVIEKRDPYDLYRASELVAIQQEFIDEVTTASTLTHPHIVQIHAVYFKDATNLQNLVVREFMRGGTLSQYLYAESERQWHEWVPLGLSQAVARDITRQIFQALAYMHSRGIAHRNLHPDVRPLPCHSYINPDFPQNILLTKSDPPFVKISGLGWAERYEPSNLAESGLSDRQPGWDEYLAPEVVVPAPPRYSSDIRADSWSAGVLVFRLLLLKSAWRVLLHDGVNSSARLRWDELDALTVPPPPSEQSGPTTLPDDGTVTIYGLPPAEYYRSLPADPSSMEAESESMGLADDAVALSSDGLSVIVDGLPLPAHLTLIEDGLAEGVRLSPDGADLLRQLLRDAPGARLSITDALEHPWLKAHTHVDSTAEPLSSSGEGQARL
ncbi:kinase-like domain-containing protein [Mycena latifolia]|nr:kinase-like domain-containing protein [Mycena latifolia]